MATIWFDMDGTIANLYGVDGWLDMLNAYDATPYTTATAMVDTDALTMVLTHLQDNGYRIGIISWLSKVSNADYDKAVKQAKLAWLHEHFANVHFDAIKIVPYGTNKWMACGEGILFDDEQKNREAWHGKAYTPEKIMKVLTSL